MPITNSLDNLLLRDAPLDHQALFGPVVRMRWMSNLFRLALLEESDLAADAHALAPSHRAEIRRLRRMSMAPSSGRYYPVDDDTADEQFLAEQARRILDAFLARQDPPDQNDPDNFDDDLVAEYRNPYESSHAYASESYPEPSLYESQENDDDDDDERDNHDPYSEYDEDSPVNERRYSARALRDDVWADDEAGQEYDDDCNDEQSEAEESVLDRILSIAMNTSVAVLVAILVYFASWFVRDAIPSTPHSSAPTGVHGTTKPAADAVPRDLDSAAAARRPAPRSPPNFDP
jgi:hypothetical protein